MESVPLPQSPFSWDIPGTGASSCWRAEGHGGGRVGCARLRFQGASQKVREEPPHSGAEAPRPTGGRLVLDAGPACGGLLGMACGSGTLSASWEVAPLFSGLPDKWTEEKWWAVGHGTYLDARAVPCAAAESLHAEQRQQEANGTDRLAPSTLTPGFVWGGLHHEQYGRGPGGSPGSGIASEQTGVLGVRGVLLTSTFLPGGLRSPGFEDGIVRIHRILIWQEGDVKGPQQLWRAEKQGGRKDKTEFHHLGEFTNGIENDERKYKMLRWGLCFIGTAKKSLVFSY